MNIGIWTISLFLICSPCIVQPANILVTVVGVAASQNLLMYRLAELMGQRGHNVTVLKIEVLPEAKSIPLKYSKQISYKMASDPEVIDLLRNNLATASWSQSASNPMPIGMVTKLFSQLRMACEKQLDNKEYIQSLNSSRFDVVVLHIVDFCTFGLTQVLGIDAYVWMSTAMLMDPMAWYSGSPLAQTYAPTIVAPSHPSGRMSFLDRMKGAFASLVMYGVFQYGVVHTYTDVFRKRFGPEFPNFDDIFKKTQLYFANSDPFFEYSRPVSPNVISVGGLTMEKPEPLNEKWQQIVNGAPKEGIVIFSLGSAANTTAMPQHIRMAFLNGFKRFPHLFIWRFVGDFPESKSVKNVIISDWLPQKDLMAHPSVKAAIIHGGYNSLTETTYLGVPVVVFPLFGDQYGNVVRVTKQNIGVRLERDGLTDEKVYEALTKVLYDTKIKENAELLGRMIREKPFSSLQQATEWLEYLAKFKRLDQLQPLSHDLYLPQFLLLDVIAVVLAVFAVVFTVLGCCLCWCMRKCRKGAGAGQKKKRE